MIEVGRRESNKITLILITYFSIGNKRQCSVTVGLTTFYKVVDLFGHIKGPENGQKNELQKQHFPAKFPRKKKGLYNTSGKNRLLSWRRHISQL